MKENLLDKELVCIKEFKNKMLDKYIKSDNIKIVNIEEHFAPWETCDVCTFRLDGVLYKAPINWVLKHYKVK